MLPSHLNDTSTALGSTQHLCSLETQHLSSGLPLK